MSAPARQCVTEATSKSERSYWKNQAIIRQRIIEKQDKTIAELTASVVQLENDYDLVEAELKLLHSQPNFAVPLKASRQW